MQKQCVEDYANGRQLAVAPEHSIKPSKNRSVTKALNVKSCVLSGLVQPQVAAIGIPTFAMHPSGLTDTGDAKETILKLIGKMTFNPRRLFNPSQPSDL
mmetsp:Transcript_816/g.1029  ORF Transcript_816/g.1029 Transcript_816/m.1029 type:complete len:99 (+) Transcript_816:296-592(+)